MSSSIVFVNPRLKVRRPHEAWDEVYGSQWVAQITDDLKKAIYMDSYGEKEPNDFKNVLKYNQCK